MKRAWTIAVLVMIVALPVLGQQKIEQIVARVNNDVILKSDVDREMELRRVELLQAGLDPARMDRELAEQSRIILRDLIDRALLLQLSLIHI